MLAQEALGEAKLSKCAKEQVSSGSNLVNKEQLNWNNHLETSRIEFCLSPFEMENDSLLVHSYVKGKDD